MRLNLKYTATFCLFVAAVSLLSGAYLRFQPVNLAQPDGTKLELFASGDEYYNWLHDKDGYTVRQNGAGWYVYLDKSASGELVFTDLLAGRDDPAVAKLTPWASIPVAQIEEKRRAAQSQLQAAGSGRAPTSGTLNNLAIFIRFSDQTEFGQSISTYSSMFNGTTGNTMQSYFLEVSYNALNVPTSFYPTPSTTVVSWQDSHPRAYYSPYSTSNTIGYNGDDERTDREFTLLVNAVNGVSSQIPAGLVVDGDNDGRVDNVCFIIKGSSDGWAELLWPHRWSIYDRYVYINSKRVYDFNFQLSDFLASSGVGVLCHEMFHSLGAPDLYHYSHDGLSPVGSWDLMENNANPPQHMGAYMKYKYGHWIPSIPELTVDGTYTLNPLVSSTNNCYKIPSPNSSTEYFVVEYRRDTGTFESSIPGSGMLIYRINPAYNGNADGPPDEVYLYRPNGTTTVNGTVSSANYSLETGRTAINATTNPTPFLSNGSAGGLQISSIGSAGNTISFVLGNPIPGAPACTIDSPANNTVFDLGSPVTVNVTATDADGTIANVAFYVDDALQYTDFSAPYSWVWNTSGYGSGGYTIKAVATDDDAITAERTVTVILLGTPDEGFETSDFTLYPWENGSPSPWTVQSAEAISGTYAAKTGPIADGASTSLSLTLNVTSPGSVIFYHKVSSEAGYDFLQFYIDGEMQGQWSGAGNWALANYPVSSGERTFSWTYSKDVAVVAGSDCAWLDHIIFPPHTLYYAPPQNLAATAGNGFVNLSWQAPASGTPTGYKIFRGGALLSTVTGLNYTDNAVVNGTTYSYYLTAVYNGGESEPTPAVEATPALISSVIIGSGVAFSSDQDAGPVNIYYRSLHGQAVYTAAELNAAGLFGPTEITQLGFYVNSPPVLALPSFIVRMKHTTATNVASWQTAANMVTVYSATSYMPTSGGYDMLVLDTPFAWNGTDNIVIDTAFNRVSEWDESGSTQYTSISNGYRYVRNDYSNQTNTFTGGSVSLFRPNVKLTFTVDEPASPEITVDPMSLVFGDVEIGGAGVLQFSVSNSGDADLEGTITTPAGFNVSGSGRRSLASREDSNSGKTARNVLNFDIAPGATAYYDLAFTPTAAVSYTGNVVVASNDADEPSLSIAVSGTGYIAPTISIDTGALTASLNVGAVSDGNFTLGNVGSQSLTFSVTESPAVDWFSAAPLSGTISGGGSQTVAYSFDAAGLEPGNYATLLLIGSNDPENPELTVSVDLEVLNVPPTIELPGSISFDSGGSLAVDFSAFVDDADNHPLSLDYAGNANVQISIDGMMVTFSAPSDWYGSETVTFSVFDGYAYAEDTVDVNVNLVYLAVPLISQISPAPEGTAIVWESVPNAAQYHVYRATEPNGTYAYLGSSTGTQYVDAEALPRAFYYVRAVTILPSR